MSLETAFKRFGVTTTKASSAKKQAARKAKAKKYTGTLGVGRNGALFVAEGRMALDRQTQQVMFGEHTAALYDAETLISGDEDGAPADDEPALVGWM